MCVTSASAKVPIRTVVVLNIVTHVVGELGDFHVNSRYMDVIQK